jgi:hypothetical protein
MATPDGNLGASQERQYSFRYHDKVVPVLFHPSLSLTEPQCGQVLSSSVFVQWYSACAQSIKRLDTDVHQRIDLESVQVQSVDFFGARYVVEGSC